MRKWIVVTMVILSLGLGAAVIGIRTMSDRNGPEITYNKDKSVYYEEGMNDSELLKGVKAMDDKDGDVSDSLTVESVYSRDNGKEAVIIFVAKDSSNNVVKSEFVMKTDKEEASKENSGSEKKEVTTGEDEEDASVLKSDSEEDIELNGNGNEQDNGNTVSASDAHKRQALAEKEEEARKLQENKLTKLNPQDPRIYLNTYYLEVPKGTSVDKLSYISNIEDDSDDIYVLWRQVQIEGELDVDTAGTYELTYYVIDSGGNVSNGAVLTVVVE